VVDQPVSAVAVGGPLDGTLLGVATAGSYEVVLADRSRHLYRPSEQMLRRPDGSRDRVFSWAGRCP